MGISVVVHTYNSEKYLEQCLKSVETCEEIIVCDMYSTDRTIEIAQKYGAKIVYHKNVGFVEPARNFAISYASQNWILILDSDEVVPPELLKHLKSLINDLPKHINGVYLPRKNYYFGDVLWFTYPNHILRFFKNGTVSYSDKVHCAPIIKGGGVSYIKKSRKELAILHYSHDTVENYISRINKYTSLELEKYLERGVKFSLGLLLARPLGEFIKCYLIKGGFMQGCYGFVVSLLFGFYKFLAAIKLWEYQLNNKSSQPAQESDKTAV